MYNKSFTVIVQKNIYLHSLWYMFFSIIASQKWGIKV